MGLKFTVSIFILFLPLAGLIHSRDGQSYSPKAPMASGGDLLKKLSIEKYNKKIEAPDFTLKDVDGNPVRLRDLRGKVVFLNFWATWCPPCRLEMPAMEKLHKELGVQGLTILAINFLENAEAVKAFYKEQHLTFTTLLDKKSEVFTLYKTWSLPTTFLINKRGELVGKVVGIREWDGVRARSLFKQLLEDKA